MAPVKIFQRFIGYVTGGWRAARQIRGRWNLPSLRCGLRCGVPLKRARRKTGGLLIGIEDICYLINIFLV